MAQNFRTPELFTAVSLVILMRWRCILNQINVNIGWDVRLAGQSANSLLQR